MATVRALVVVGSAEPATTDGLADVLRQSFAVRTAYNEREVLDRLDPEVDVVLVDPNLGAVGAIHDAVTGRGLDCQVGLLAATTDDDRVDAAVPPEAPDGEVRDRVQRLATRARYRKTLEEYYDLARRRAAANADEADGDGAAVAEERERLRARLDRLGRRLDEAADPLDAAALFRAALDDE